MATAPTAQPARCYMELIEHKEYLMNFAMTLTRDRSKAEDLIQDTFVRALRFQHKFDGKNAKAWLSTILVRKFYTDYRRNKLHDKFIKDGEMDLDDVERFTKEEKVDISESGFKEIVSDEVLAALKSLSEDHHTMIILADLHGCSYKEVADAVGIPVGTVMSRLHRARASFRKSYREVK